MILGPSYRTITSAPDIDITVPTILARVFELFKASFSILFEAPRYIRLKGEKIESSDE